MIPSTTDTIIVGAGPAGLACALQCQKNDKQFLLVELSDRVGGRVGSIQEDGFIFDLGFQVYNTAYEITNSLLDLDNIRLNHFRPGAMIHDGASFQIISDPFRDVSQVFKTLFSNIMTMNDKVKVLKLKNSLNGYRIDRDTEGDMNTYEFLLDQGFSDRMIEMFFRPFFSGIFLETKLETSSRFFKYVFSMFSIGLASLPERGMQAIPNDMLSRIDQGRVVLGKKVIGMDKEKKIMLDDGGSVLAGNMVLTGDSGCLVTNLSYEYNMVKTLYFSSRIEPAKGDYIHLFPCDDLINNIAVPTSISSAYTRNSDHLISVTILDNDLPEVDLIKDVQNRLMNYYGGDRGDFEFLKYLEIKKGTLSQLVGQFNRPRSVQDNIFIAGELDTNGSIEGAVLSGLNVARLI